MTVIRMSLIIISSPDSRELLAYVLKTFVRMLRNFRIVNSPNFAATDSRHSHKRHSKLSVLHWFNSKCCCQNC